MEKAIEKGDWLVQNALTIFSGQTSWSVESLNQYLIGLLFSFSTPMYFVKSQLLLSTFFPATTFNPPNSIPNLCSVNLRRSL